MSPRQIGVTEVALRDAHQSLMATRMAMEDMVDACADIDAAGYWSVECWGGATFDSCIRFLNEDPWERLRTFRKLLPIEASDDWVVYDVPAIVRAGRRRAAAHARLGPAPLAGRIDAAAVPAAPAGLCAVCGHG